MISSTKEKITIGRPPCKQQENSIDCGLFAIANATEFCYSSTIQFVDFDEKQLPSHWLQCLEKGSLVPFPRLSKRPKKVKEVEDFDVISTYCKCHLPGNYGDMVLCDGLACGEWFHYLCVGLKEEPDTWYCEACTKSQL